jgi:hypothetical protein
MPISSCIEEVMAASGVSREDAAKMLDRIDALAARHQARSGLDRDSAVRIAAKEIADQADAVAAIQRRNQLMNLQKRVARRARIEETARAIGGKNGVDLVRAVRNTMVAINTPARGGRLSAEAEGRTWHDRYTSGLTRELDRAGLFQAARSNQFQREWGRELYELSMENDMGESQSQSGGRMDR